MAEDHSHENMAPRVPMLLAGGLVVLTVLGVIFQQLVVNPQARASAPRAVLAERVLRFVDIADGTVVVVDAGAGTELARVAPGEGNFLRGTLRGLVRERRLQSADFTPGFALRRYGDGAIVVADLATGREIDLRAFGARNADEFMRYLPASEAPAPAADTRLAER